jgi:hypothetical protein
MHELRVSLSGQMKTKTVIFLIALAVASLKAGEPYPSPTPLSLEILPIAKAGETYPAPTPVDAESTWQMLTEVKPTPTPTQPTPSPKALASDDKAKKIEKCDLASVALRDAENIFGANTITQSSGTADISYCDLTGDGIEEAAVVVRDRFLSDVLVYGSKNGKPFLIARVEEGDKSHGGICEAFICGSGANCRSCEEFGLGKKGDHGLIVRRYRPADPDCNSCYGFVEETLYQLRGNNLVVANTVSRAIDKLDQEDVCWRSTR